MRIETVIAVILGVLVGGTFAYYLTTKTVASGSRESINISTAEAFIGKQKAEAQEGEKNGKFAVTAPADNTLVKAPQAVLQIEAPKASLIVIQTSGEEKIFKNTQSVFTESVKLSAGENVIEVTAYNKELPVGVSSQSLTLYYLP